MRKIDSWTRLKESGIRATRKKSAILDAIADSPRPVDACFIHSKVKSTAPMDLATVYRTLTLFKAKSLVREVVDKTGVQFYELAESKNRAHPHFKCDVCDLYFCLPSLDNDNAEALSGLAGDFKVKDYAITMNGVCAECQEENA